MKKLSILCLTGLLTVCLAGCGGTPGATVEPAEDTVPGVTLDEGLVPETENTVPTEAAESTTVPAAGGITGEEAVEIALDHAGIRVEDASGLRIRPDEDGGRGEYEIRFTSGGMEYEYEIDAESGKILSVEREEYGPREDGTVPDTGYIGDVKAKAIALDHAGVNEEDVDHLIIRLEQDDGRMEYEVEFWAGRMEYSYDIDAVTGDILSYEAEDR